MKKLNFAVVKRQEFFHICCRKKLSKTYLYVDSPVSTYSEFINFQRFVKELIEFSRAQKYRIVPAIIIEPMGLKSNKILLRKQVKKWLK